MDAKNQNSVLLDRAEAALLSRDYPLAARIYSDLLKQEPRNLSLLS